ncbi:MAG: ASKHA domain-containing protein [Peptococcaceae bacterium]|nr:ASKHA domain-containing protein [Peptococcaceae bacterium]
MIVTFFPSGNKIEVKRGTLLADAAELAGVRIQSPCGYAKTCGKCKVQVLDPPQPDGNEGGAYEERLSRLTSEELKKLTERERENGMRLACCAKVFADVRIFLPPESRVGVPLILDKVRGRQMVLKPAVLPYYLELTPPTLADHRDDYTRIKDALAVIAPQLRDLHMDYRASRELSGVLRRAKWQVTVLILYDREIIGVRGGEVQDLYGMAIDIGTTTVAAYLCNLNNGKLMQSASALNRQTAYGADILSRISYCMHQEDGLENLNQALRRTVNGLIQELTTRQASDAGINVDPADVVEMTLVFNTVMQHIALNIPPDTLGVSPFISTYQEGVDIKARDLGFEIMPGANVHCLPSIAGFIGADCTAVLISEEPHRQDKRLLLIDIGTNSEICLGNRAGLYSTSCATGPALEGAEISCGMRAEGGAIQHVAIDPHTLEPELDVIGGEIPRGICGSGIIDVVAQMAESGLIAPDGKFVKDLDSSRVRLDAGGKKYEYVLYFGQGGAEKDVVVTQKDVRAVQLAKAALYSGAMTLMQASGITKIDGVILAGAFGNYIDKANAVKLGLFPDCSLDDVRVVGNAAGEGARLALINTDKREEAYQVAKSVTFIESAADEGFYKLFGEAITIPHEKDLFLANLKGVFPCTGIDDRVLPEAVLAKGALAHRDIPTMLWSARVTAALEKQSFLRLPLSQTIETQSYGAELTWSAGTPLSSGYIFTQAAQLSALSREAFNAWPVQHVLKCIRQARGEKIILDIAGPFSILGGLIDPTALIRAAITEKALVGEALAHIEDFLVQYIEAALAAGVQVISLADPIGVMEIVGQRMYKEISGRTLYAVLKRVYPALDHALIHLCGKTSASLQKTGWIVLKPRRISKDRDYRETLFELAEEKNIRLAGHHCINHDACGESIFWHAELR